MIETLAFPIEKVKQSRIGEIDFSNLQFGKVMSDHMLVAHYADGKWSQPHIAPYGPIDLMPAISALHYGQAIFEGMKAYRTENNGVAIFRPEANFERFNNSAERMCMPTVPSEIFIGGLLVLI